MLGFDSNTKEKRAELLGDCGTMAKAAKPPATSAPPSRPPDAMCPAKPLPPETPPPRQTSTPHTSDCPRCARQPREAPAAVRDWGLGSSTRTFQRFSRARLLRHLCRAVFRPRHAAFHPRGATLRIKPSCATDATNCPSRVKIRPRLNPRPPPAHGLSIT